MKVKDSLLKKRHGIPALGLLLVLSSVGVAAASIAVWTGTSTIVVQEPFSVASDLPGSIGVYAGESNTYHVTVTNAANVGINAEVEFEITADEGVNVEVSIPDNPSTVPLHDSHTFNITITAEDDSATGSVTINWSVLRGE